MPAVLYLMIESVQLRIETGRVVPFAGTGRVVVTLNFKCFGGKPKEQVSAKQDSLSHFSGHYRQRDSGFGELAVPGVAISFARQIILTSAKKWTENV